MRLSPPLSRRVLGPFAVSELQHQPAAELPPHDHATATLTLILSGTQYETIGLRRYERATHSATLKGASIEHANRIGPRPTQGLFVEVADEAAVSASDAGSWPAVEYYADGGSRLLVRRIGRELRLREPGWGLIVEGLIFELLGLLRRARAVQPRGRGDRALRLAVDFLEAHYRARLSVSQIAGHAGVSPSYLAELFRARYAMSLGEWVRERRLDFAREALLDPGAPISGIAFRAGFSDQSHLTRLFRGRFGVTPADYRRRMR